MTKQQQINEFWQTVTFGRLPLNGYQLSYAFIKPEQAKAAVTIVNGRCESYQKYQELAFDLYQQGYAVFLYDHLGQGLSERLLANPHKGYIDDFSSYTDGLAMFVNKVVAVNWQGSHFLLAHSMGAAISYLYLANYKHPFDKAVLSAPMFGIPTNGIPLPIAKGLVAFLSRLGFNKHYFFGQRNYVEKPFLNNQLMQSQTRYQAFRTLYNNEPQLQLGGVTVGWLKQAFHAIDTIQHTTPTLPIFLLQAEKDTIVLNSTQNKILNKYPQIISKSYPNSLHEILFEINEIRDQALDDINRFFRAN